MIRAATLTEVIEYQNLVDATPVAASVELSGFRWFFTVTAATPGAAGNAITIELLVDGGGTVGVNGDAIVVHIINGMTADQVVDMLNDSDASDLVTASDSGGDFNVTAQGVSFLSNGDDGTDRYGQPRTSWSDPVEVRAMLKPLKALEALVAEDRRLTTYRVICQPVEDLTSLSRVTWRGKVLEVLGEPLLAADRNGPAHIDFTAREVLGG